MGVLPLLDRLDESGKIVPQEQHKQAEEEEKDDEMSEHELQTVEDQKRFVTIFKKVWP